MLKKIFRKDNLLVTGLLAALVAVSFYDVVFGGRTFKVSTAVAQSMPYGVYGQADNQPESFLTLGVDSAVYEEPILRFARDCFRAGRLPLWNPHQAGGYPLVAMIQHGIYFPLHLLVYLFPDAWGWDLLILARFLLAGILMFFFMRYLPVGRIAALTAAVCFMLSGPMILIQNQTANTDILIPLFLLVLERLMRRPDRRAVLLVAATVWLVILSGHPEHILLIHLFGAAYLIFRLLTGGRRFCPPRVVYYGLIGGLLGTGLAAPVLLPFVWNFTHVMWHGHPSAMGLLVEDVPGRIMSILLPHAFQRAAMSQDWVPIGWLGGYLGVVPVALALLSLLGRQKRGLNYFFVATAVLLVGKSYGWWWINWIGALPVLKACRFGYHTPVLTAFCVAAAAGLGARALLSGGRVLARGTLVTALLGLLIAVFLFVARDQPFSGTAASSAWWAGALLTGWAVLLFLRYRGQVRRPVLGGLLVCLVIVELFSYIYRDRPRRYATFPPVPYIEFLRNQDQPARAYGLFGAFFPNTGMAYGVDDLGIFDGLIMKNFVGFINHLVLPANFVPDLRPTTLRAVPLQQGQPFLDLLNLRYLIVPSGVVLPADYVASDRLKKIYDQEVQIYERQGALPRAFIAPQVIFAPRSSPDDQLLFSLADRLDQVVVLNHRPVPQIVSQMSAAPTAGRATARITRSVPGRVEVAADLSRPGFLVVSETYHPDWQAFVDGQASPVYEADGLLPAVFLPAGRHAVRLVFRPVAFYWGCGVMLLAAGLCGWICAARRDFLL